MFEIHFYLRDKRTAKAKHENKPTPFQIEMHIHCGLPKPVVLYTGERIFPEDWNKKTGRAKGKEYDHINRRIMELRRKAEDVYYELKNREILTWDNFKMAIATGKVEKDFFDYWQDFMEESKSRVSKLSGQKLKRRTFQHYNTCIDGFKEFAKKHPMTFKSMDMKFYGKARTYFINELELHPNTFGNYIKGLKTFLNWALNQGLPVNPIYRSFEKPQMYQEAEPLNGEELLKLWSLDLGDKQHYLDIFLFLCSTGLRISDYNSLSKSNFKTDHLDLSQSKTSGQAIIPFFDDLYFRPKFIFEKYKGELPKLSGQKLNDALKEIMKLDEVKFTRIPVTSKTGRKTFATLKLMQGISPYTVMKSTGHKDYKSFQHYVGISPDDVIRENKEKAQLFKVS